MDSLVPHYRVLTTGSHFGNRSYHQEKHTSFPIFCKGITQLQLQHYKLNFKTLALDCVQSPLDAYELTYVERFETQLCPKLCF